MTPVHALTDRTAAAAAQPHRKDAAADFERALTAASSGDQVRDAARGLVSSAFLLPMLAQVRASAKEGDLLHGGFGEDVWRQQLDTMIADRILQKSNFSVVEAVYRNIVPKQAEADVYG